MREVRRRRRSGRRVQLTWQMAALAALGVQWWRLCNMVRCLQIVPLLSITNTAICWCVSSAWISLAQNKARWHMVLKTADKVERCQVCLLERKKERAAFFLKFGVYFLVLKCAWETFNVTNVSYCKLEICLLFSENRIRTLNNTLGKLHRYKTTWLVSCFCSFRFSIYWNWINILGILTRKKYESHFQKNTHVITRWENLQNVFFWLHIPANYQDFWDCCIVISYWQLQTKQDLT